MALGGGVFVTQNKVLPGCYINFVSAAKAGAGMGDRGVATMPLELDWGVDGEVFAVTADEMQKDSMRIFGYDYTNEKLKGLRDLFRNAETVYCYRLNSGERASNTYATAKCSGIRGNDLSVVILENVDDSSRYDVRLYWSGLLLDSQTVATAAELTDNDFVSWKAAAPLAATAATPLAGGTNGTVTGESYQAYLDKIEAYSFNAMGAVTTDSTVKGLLESFCKRLRDEVGVKFQLVLQSRAADYEGVVNVKNTVSDSGCSAASLVYWVTGLIAGCEVNKSNLNKLYDGEFTVDADFKQSELEKAIASGEFALHKVGNDLRVLADINSLVTTSAEKGEIFKENQTVRVADRIATDIAALFNNKYLGTVPNDESGRISLWADIVKHHQALQDIRAIEEFSDADVTVAQGDTKKSVVVTDKITVVNAMAQLYMTVTVA